VTSGSIYGSIDKFAAWISTKPRLLQINGLIAPVAVELCAPYFVNALALRAVEGHGGSEPDVEVAKVFKGGYQFFGVELSASSLQRRDYNAGVHVTFRRFC